MADVYGLTARQHYNVGRLIDAAGISKVESAGRSQKRPPLATRVCLLGFDAIAYDPTAARSVACFEWRPDQFTHTVEMVGRELSGDIELTFSGETLRVPCNATNEALRTAVYDWIGSRTVRVTSLPGRWEFAWIDRTGFPTFTAEPYEPADPLDESAFTGGTIVRQEAWRVLSYDGETVETVPVVDALPFPTGNIPNGAIGIAVPTYSAAYVVSAWQCRSFSFAEPPTDDIVTNGGGSDGEEEEPTGGGGGGPGETEEPPE